MSDRPKFIFNVQSVIGGNDDHIFFTAVFEGALLGHEFLAAANTPNNQSMIKEGVFVKAQMTSEMIGVADGLERAIYVTDVESHFVKTAKILKFPKPPK